MACKLTRLSLMALWYQPQISAAAESIGNPISTLRLSDVTCFDLHLVTLLRSEQISKYLKYWIGQLLRNESLSELITNLCMLFNASYIHTLPASFRSLLRRHCSPNHHNMSGRKPVPNNNHKYQGPPTAATCSG